VKIQLIRPPESVAAHEAEAHVDGPKEPQRK
jgi:hypothetical protein